MSTGFDLAAMASRSAFVSETADAARPTWDGAKAAAEHAREAIRADRTMVG